VNVAEVFVEVSIAFKVKGWSGIKHEKQTNKQTNVVRARAGLGVHRKA
jgi:hypothetical protein